MSNPLAIKISYYHTLKYTLPTIIMMFFLSIYSMVDGIFVSNLIGTEALSAINIVYPIINVIMAIGIMLATGGSAIVAKQMGEKKNEEARKSFSMIIYFAIILALIISVFGIIFIDPILIVLGASIETYTYAYDYISLIFLFTTLLMLQLLFQTFFVTAGKPMLGLITTILGGVCNIVLDYIFIAELNMGIAGAAVATGISYAIPGIFGLLYFTLNKKSTLSLIKVRFENKILMQACSNGSSEMVINLSVALTTFLFNIITKQLLGVDGIAAITIILYAEFLLSALFIGYCSGVSPLISYNYGEGNIANLKKLHTISLVFISIISISMFISANLLSNQIVGIFSGENRAVMEIALLGLKLFSFAFLVKGFNAYASALFTALSNGKISALLSFIRTFALIAPFIVILPSFIGVTGVWLAVPLAELVALAFSAYMLWINRKDYQYM